MPMDSNSYIFFLFASSAWQDVFGSCFMSVIIEDENLFKTPNVPSEVSSEKRKYGNWLIDFLLFNCIIVDGVPK